MCSISVEVFLGLSKLSEFFFFIEYVLEPPSSSYWIFINLFYFNFFLSLELSELTESSSSVSKLLVNSSEVQLKLCLDDLS